MKIELKKYITYCLATLGFIIVALAYFHPVLKGKKIYQSDIAQYIGVAKQQIDLRNTTGEEIYWNERAFAGMPTYQLGAKYPHNYIKQLDYLIRFLPRPADYLFLYFISFFILLCCLKVDPLLAFFGSLVFGFSTYMIIIIGVGHNAKAHAIGYMPLVLSGFLLVLNNKYLKGGILFCVSLALELVANHFQMTYYLFLLLLVIGIVYLIKAVNTQKLPQFVTSVGVLMGGLLLAIALNATSILATREYSEFSTRGTSELTINPDGSPKKSNKGLDKNYILQYSYGFLETFNLLVPRFLGGSSSEDAGNDAAIVKELTKLGYPYKDAKNFAKNAPTYWGDQPIVGAPAYIGAGIIFLFVLGLFLIEGYKKWWVVTGSVLALLLSYGKNLDWFSDIFINYFPLYSKFRAVTSIQVIIELCIPLFGIFTLSQFFKSTFSTKEKTLALYKATGIVGGLLLLFVVFKNTLFSFIGPSDTQFIESAGYGFVSALREDRARMLTNDSLRSLLFIIAIAAVLFFYLKSKIKNHVAIVAIGVLLCLDLVPVAWRYVNTEGFVSAKKIDTPFKATAIDKQISKDPSRFRVYDLSQGNPMSTAKTSFFHNSIGGYHGAKPKRIQELFDFHMSQGNQSVLNMLNVKYFIFNTEKEGLQLQVNDSALGNAWFVKKVEVSKDPNQEITSLSQLDITNTAIVPHETPLEKIQFSLDSLATIQLTKEHPHGLEYTAKNNSEGFAVFSEVFYKKGWKAFVNGQETEIIKTNYALRGLPLPPGENQIIFSFEPQVVKTGSTISLVASLLLLIIVAGSLVYLKKQSQN